MTAPRRQRGVALITVMLVVALVTIIAASMTDRLQLMVRKGFNQQGYQQGMWIALAGEELVLKVLKQDFEDSKDVVHLDQYWAQTGIVLPVADGQIAASVEDLHGCFNLNALGKVNSAENASQRPLAERQFTALLKALEIEDYQADLLSGSLRDWLDANDNVDSSYGAEDSNYASRTVPHLTANSPMVTVTELLAVEGSTASLYKKIRPYVCVIPQNTELLININTIRPEQAQLLVGMFEGKISLDDARDILDSRGNAGYTSIEDFWALPEVTAVTPSDELKGQFSVDSKDFRALLTFSSGQRRISLESLLNRQTNGNLQVISRQFGEIE